MWCIFFWAGMNFCSGTSPDESNINNYNLNYYAIGGYFISLKLSWGQDFLKGKKREYRSVTAKVARKSHVTPRCEWGQRQEGGPGRTPKPPAKWGEPRKGDAAETKEQRVGGVGGVSVTHVIEEKCLWKSPTEQQWTAQPYAEREVLYQIRRNGLGCLEGLRLQESLKGLS